MAFTQQSASADATCQGRAGYDVADGINARYVGAVLFIDEDFVALGLDTQLFQADAFDVGFDADGREDDVGNQRLCALLAFDLDVALAFGVYFHRFHGGRGEGSSLSTCGKRVP